jgi:hypothetical protein
MPASKLRSAAIAGLFLVLIVGQVYAMIARDEAWPFSHYPMYADTQGPNVSAVQVEGRRADGSPYAVSVRRELLPFDPSRLLGFFRRVARKPDAKERSKEAARALLELYELERTRGHHQGPALVELSVYETTWRIVPSADNVGRPSKRRLIATSRAGER